jgi:hypothetical protein
LVNATILDQATWLFDLQDDPFFAGKVVFVQGSIWENCVGEEIDDKIAGELHERIGVSIPKGEDGKYRTNGHLSRESIENQIHFFERIDPNQIESRIWGANVQTFGSEFKQFSTAIHVVPARVIPRNWPVIQIVDPHPVKPDLCAYAAIDPMDHIHFFEEWPHMPWEKLNSRNKTIEQICIEWTMLEAQHGISDQIVCRIGDPNRFNTADSRDNLALWALYERQGFSFNLFINDSLEFGHQLIHSALWCDKRLLEKDPLDSRFQPKMTFAEGCRNLANSMKFYGRKPQKDATAAISEQIDKKWKDAIDLIRYANVFVHDKSFSQLKSLSIQSGGDYEKVLRSRQLDSEINDDGIAPEKLKGGRLVSVNRW